MLGDRFPSLVSVRAFEAAARLGSFARAARELGTTAASVSYHVRRLERDIGVPLFVRGAQSVALTEAGKTVAEGTLKAFAGLRASFARAVEEDDRRLSITTLPSLGASWLTPKLGRFRAHNPEVRVELDLTETAHDLAGGRFDIAIRNGHGDWPGMRARAMFPAIFLPLCAPHVLGSVRFDASKEHAVALLGRPDWWAIWYRACGIGAPPPPATFGTTLAYEHLDVAAAIAGQGVVIASPIVFRDEIESGRLVIAHEAVATDGRAFWITFAQPREHVAKIVRGAEWLCDEAANARTAAATFIAAAKALPGG